MPEITGISQCVLAKQQPGAYHSGIIMGSPLCLILWCGMHEHGRTVKDSANTKLQAEVTGVVNIVPADAGPLMPIDHMSGKQVCPRPARDSWACAPNHQPLHWCCSGDIKLISLTIPHRQACSAEAHFEHCHEPTDQLLAPWHSHCLSRWALPWEMGDALGHLQNQVQAVRCCHQLLQVFRGLP